MVTYPFAFDPTVHVEDTDCSCGGVSYEDVQTIVAGEATTRASADTTLQTNITTEATTRATADTTLQTALTAETTARTTADTNLQTTLQANITAEETARTTADTTLQTNINTTNGNLTVLSNAFYRQSPKLTWTKVCDVANKGQGFAFDGTYFYSANNFEEDTGGYIYKYDTDGNVIASATSSRASHYNSAFIKDDKVYFGGDAGTSYYGFDTDDLAYSDAIDFGVEYRSVTYDSERGLYYAIEIARNVLVCIDSSLDIVYRTPLIQFSGERVIVQAISCIAKDVFAIAYCGDLNSKGAGIFLCGVDGICQVAFNDNNLGVDTATTCELEQVQLYESTLYAYDRVSKAFYSTPFTYSTYYSKFPTVNTNYMVNSYHVYHREISEATQFTSSDQTFTFDTTEFPVSYYNTMKVRLFRPEVHEVYDVDCAIHVRDDSTAYSIKYYADFRGQDTGSVDVIYLTLKPTSTALVGKYTSQLKMDISTGLFTSGTTKDSAPKLLDIWLER